MHNASWGCEGGREGFKASINARDSPECVALLLDRGADPTLGDLKGNTPIHTAANTNAPDSLALLLSRVGNPNLLNNFLSTPLHRTCKYGALPTILILLKSGKKKMCMR